MPNDINETLLKGRFAKISKSIDDFYKEQKNKMPKRKPVKTKKEYTGTMFAKRNKRIAIIEAGLRHVSIIIDYRKVNGERKKYVLNPYSWRTRKLKNGFRRVLFAEDKNDKKQIKMFVLQNIFNVVITDQKYKPRWPVEL